MPELPEVESVRKGLHRVCQSKSVANLQFRRRDLRIHVPDSVKRVLEGATIVAVRRRAKYLIFETTDFVILNHLGMSGSWRVLQPDEILRTHDHCVLTLEDGTRLAFHDPRRFGFFDWASRTEPLTSRWLDHLGPEPLSPAFHAAGLREQARNRRIPVKSFLMDQKVVVGVGNIYASEALFRAGVRPRRGVHRITRAQWEAVVTQVQMVLKEAIESGGTTLKDHRNGVNDSPGEYRSRLFVYGRAGEPCRQCDSPIQQKVLAARSTYWCSHCQL